MDGFIQERNRRDILSLASESESMLKTTLATRDWRSKEMAEEKDQNGETDETLVHIHVYPSSIIIMALWDWEIRTHECGIGNSGLGLGIGIDGL